MDAHEYYDLTGKVAIVTGGAGWLGTPMSEALAEMGATVAVIDINRDAIDRVVDSLESRNLKAIGKVADTIEETSLRKVIDEVANELGRLDVLINCAYKTPTPLLDETTGDDMQEAFKAATAFMVGAQQAAIHMRKVGGGSIINVGSMYGSVTGYPEVYKDLMDPNPITYQASKGAVLQITRHLSVYYAEDGIRVNTLSPGPFPNPNKPGYKEDPNLKEFVRRLGKNSPMGRIGRPDEFKGPVTFLASNASSYVTGQNLLVDGGWTVW
tara:strand:- start:17132 stop:17935 length:804 start_codon:yes stop_codon:yes gene_type:complete